MRAGSTGLAELFVRVGVRGAVFLAVVLGITGLMRSASASLRHSLLAAGVVGVLAMPVAALLPWSLPLLPPLPGLQVTGAQVESASPAQVEIEILQAPAGFRFGPAGTDPVSTPPLASPTPRGAPPASTPAESIPAEMLLLALWARACWWPPGVHWPASGSPSSDRRRDPCR